MLAATVFAVASLTDAIDCYLARSPNWVTTLGKLMDPIADKFQVVMVVLIAVHGRPAWVDALIYVTVLITVLSGADYFFGVWSRERLLRRRVEPRPPARVNR